MEPLQAGEPTEVGSHQLLGRLGSGGFGPVYLARSAEGRTVALKVAHPRVAEDADVRTGLRAEFAAATRIGPVRCAQPVVAADADAELPWISSEFVAAPTLEALVERHGPLPERTVRALGAGLAAALADLHHAGSLHRDLKPSNVLITPEGPRLIDHGLARAVDGEQIDKAALIVGSPGYLSPELARGKESGPAGEVFSLGAVLAYAATARPPFDGSTTAALLYHVAHGKPDLAGAPEGLREVLKDCLSRKPGPRPTPDELADRLQAGGADGAFTDWLSAEVAEDLNALTDEVSAGTAGDASGAGAPGATAAPGSGEAVTVALAAGAAPTSAPAAPAADAPTSGTQAETSSPAPSATETSDVPDAPTAPATEAAPAPGDTTESGAAPGGAAPEGGSTPVPPKRVDGPVPEGGPRPGGAEPPTLPLGTRRQSLDPSPGPASASPAAPGAPVPRTSAPGAPVSAGTPAHGVPLAAAGPASVASPPPIAGGSAQQPAPDARAGVSRRRVLGIAAGVIGVGALAAGAAAAFLPADGGTSNESAAAPPAPDAAPTANPSAESYPTPPPGTAPEPLWSTRLDGRELARSRGMFAQDDLVFLPGSPMRVIEVRSSKPAWNSQDLSAAYGRTGYVTAKGMVFFAGPERDGTLVAVSARSGKEVWTAHPGNGLSARAPLAADDQYLYAVADIEGASVNGGSTALCALPLDGSRGALWHKPLDLRAGNGSSHAVATTTGFLAHGTEDDTVTVRESETGRQLWQTRAATGRASPVPFIHEDVLLLGGPELRAHHLVTGKELWRHQPRHSSGFRTPAAFKGGFGHVFEDDGTLWRLEVRTGRPQWVRPATDGAPAGDEMVQRYGTLYVASAEGKGVTAFSLRDGAPRWTFRDEGSAADSWHVALAGPRLLARHGTTLYCLPAV